MARMGVLFAGIWAVLCLAPGPAARPCLAGEAEGAGAPALGYAKEQVYHVVDRVPRATLLAREVDQLIDNVVALNERHGWRWSQAGSLIASLEEAFIDLNRGQFHKAAGQLSDFSNRVAVYVDDGILTRDAGVPLLDAAGGILGRIEALERAGRLAGPGPSEPGP